MSIRDAMSLDFLPWSTFTRIVARYGGDQRVRTLSCGEHYRAMAFAQLTYRESLRDIARLEGLAAQLTYDVAEQFTLTAPGYEADKVQSTALDTGSGVCDVRHR
jgi:hypothetical protein